MMLCLKLSRLLFGKIFKKISKNEKILKVLRVVPTKAILEFNVGKERIRHKQLRL